MPEEKERKMAMQNLPGVKSRERFAEVQYAQNAGTALRQRASHFARERRGNFPGGGRCF